MVLLSDCGGTCVRTTHEIGVRLTFSAFAASGSSSMRAAWC
jgi:hypothetical protein